jgi:hypothetical protein
LRQPYHEVLLVVQPDRGFVSSIVPPPWLRFANLYLHRLAQSRGLALHQRLAHRRRVAGQAAKGRLVHLNLIVVPHVIEDDLVGTSRTGTPFKYPMVGYIVYFLPGMMGMVDLPTAMAARAGLPTFERAADYQGTQRM